MPRMPREIRLERDLKAVDLRKAGYEYEAIARECGYKSKTNAWYAVQRILKAATREAADELRTLEVQRLDDIMRPQYAQAIKGNQAAVDRVLRIMERRSRLLGLDAPTKSELTGANGGPVQLEDTLSDDDRLARIAALVDRARARRDGSAPGDDANLLAGGASKPETA